MDRETQKRLSEAHLGVSPSRVDARAGLVGALAGGAGDSLDHWLAHTFNYNFDAYDKAIDAAYNATHVGGSQLHHLVDGQHSFLGAVASVRDVAADDGLAREVLNAGEHLLRDTSSVSGTNVLYSMTPEQFNHVADSAASLGITKTYLADAFTVNGSELLGGVLGLAGAVVLARSGDVDRLSRFGGALVTSSVASANPVLMAVAGASMAYSLWKTEDRTAAVRQAGKGALVSGSAILATHLVGGPVWLGCLVGIGTAILVGKAVDNPQKAYERMQALLRPAGYILRKTVDSFSFTPDEGAARTEP